MADRDAVLDTTTAAATTATTNSATTVVIFRLRGSCTTRATRNVREEIRAAAAIRGAAATQGDRAGRIRSVVRHIQIREDQIGPVTCGATREDGAARRD